MKAKANSDKAQALLDFTNEIVRKRGRVSNATLQSVQNAGFSNKAILETIGIIGIYTTLQYIRQMSLNSMLISTELDHT